MAMTAKNKFRLAILCFQLVNYLRTITLEIYGYLWQNDVPSYLILPFIFTLRALSCSDSGGGGGGGGISILQVYKKYPQERLVRWEVGSLTRLVFVQEPLPR